MALRRRRRQYFVEAAYKILGESGHPTKYTLTAFIVNPSPSGIDTKTATPPHRARILLYNVHQPTD